MKVEPLCEKHLRSIKVREFEVTDLGENISDELITYWLSSTHAFSLIDDNGEVIAAMGGIVNKGACHTWLIASQMMYKYPAATLKLAIRLHQDGIRDYGVKKFFTYNLPQFKREIIFLQSLGYRAKGTASDFHDSKERILFVKEVG